MISSIKEATIRPATADDMTRIRELHGDNEAFAGMKLDLPEMFVADGTKAPYILALYVVEENGEIIGGYYVEKAVELCFFGRNPRATAVARQHVQLLTGPSKAAGIRFIHCAIPVECPEVGKHLEHTGFEPTTKSLSYYKLDLR